MGESLVETPQLENKMGESVPCLQESVSFGRFEHDSLCWERWSTFPTNKYLEEVEKCSTPGSVAQKKAYFEAHYKKIAARKAELLDQERARETEPMNSEVQMFSVCSIGEEELDSETLKAQNSATGTEVANEEVEFVTEATDADVAVRVVEIESFDKESEVSNIYSEVNEFNDDINDCVETVSEKEELQPRAGDASIDLYPAMEIPEIEETKLPTFVEEEGMSILDLQTIEKLPQSKVEVRGVVDVEVEGAEELAQDQVEEREISEEQAEIAENLDNSEKNQKESSQGEAGQREIAKREEDPVKSQNATKMQKALPKDKFREREFAIKGTKHRLKSENPKKIQKEVPVKRTTSIVNAKKKPASLIPQKSSSMAKSQLLCTPKPSKPVLSKSTMSITRPTVKKENGYTPLTSKKTTRPETKRVLPTSLHMSLSLGPSNSDPAAVAMTRKSLIMERMGDKDIVKRAFKAFQNASHLSPSSLTKTPTTNKSATKKIERGSALDTFQKKHEGITRVKPLTPQLGTKKTAVSPGLDKTMGDNQRIGKSTSLGLRSQDQAYKQKEVSKNHEQKAKTKEAGKTHLQSKAKTEKPTPTKPPICNINSKGKLASSYDQGQGFFKGLRKDDTKTQASDQ